MIRIKTNLVFSIILFMVASVSFAQSQPPSSGQTKGSNHTQEQIRGCDPSTDNVKRVILAPSVVRKSSKVISKKRNFFRNFKRMAKWVRNIRWNCPLFGQSFKARNCKKNIQVCLSWLPKKYSPQNVQSYTNFSPFIINFRLFSKSVSR